MRSGVGPSLGCAVMGRPCSSLKTYCFCTSTAYWTGCLKMILACRSFCVRHVAIGIAVSFALLFCAVGAAAQASRVGATFEGTVSDTSGAVIPNSRVTLHNPLTNQSRTVTTDEQGFFRAEQLPVGSYEVRVEQIGFAPYRQAGVQASLGQTVHLDIVLAPASASEQVTVNAQPSSLDASQSSVVSSVDQERIEELPVRSRNYLDFVLLAPGVSSSPIASGASGSTPLAGSGFTFGGLRSRSNNLSIDGLDNNDEYTGSSRSELSPEIVQEFQVVNNGLSAESGEAAGKLDHQLTRNTALMLRYTFTNNKESGDAFNTNGLIDASARGSSFTSDNALSGSLTTVLGSAAVSDLRFQAATRHAVLRTNKPFGPEIDVAGLVTFARPYAGNSERRENHYQANYTYSRTRGKHLWKVGGTVNRIRLRADIPDGFDSVYLFGSLGDFLAGNPNQFRQAFGSSSVNFPVTSVGVFVQDHWSLARQLTIDLGVRYDFDRLPAEFNEDTNNVSPRVGLAWSPSLKWVFRAGYGSFFDRYVLANLTRAIEKNGSQAFEQVADGTAAASLFATAQGGPLVAPAFGIAPSVVRPDPRMATPYSQQASAGAEYLLAKNLTLRADYLFVHGVKLSRTINVNLLPPVVLTLANSSSLGIPNPTPQQIGREVFSPGRLNTQFGDIYQLQNSASSTYNGVSFTLNRRMSDELPFS